MEHADGMHQADDCYGKTSSGCDPRMLAPKMLFAGSVFCLSSDTVWLAGPLSADTRGHTADLCREASCAASLSGQCAGSDGREGLLAALLQERSHQAG